MVNDGRLVSSAVMGTVATAVLPSVLCELGRATLWLTTQFGCGKVFSRPSAVGDAPAPSPHGSARRAWSCSMSKALSCRLAMTGRSVAG